MSKEEQEQEIEILESIYPDELEKRTDTQFNVHLALETKPRKFLVLEVEYPDEYPEVVPTLGIDTTDGSYLPPVEEDEDEVEAHQRDEFTKEDLKSLLDQTNEQAEENVGMPSIFTLTSFLKDTAEELYNGKVKQREKQRLDEILAQEEKDNEKFRGTPVTPESFAEWREKFRAEFKLDEEPKKDKSKLTGKEIFERGLNKDADEDEGDSLANETAQLSV